MSMVMFVIGCVAIMVGVVMVGFGIPVNEFSFGNTLIVSGTTLATGGLLVISLSAVVTQLHRVADALAGRAPVLPARPAEALEAPAAEPRPVQARIPFPPKQPAIQPATREPRPADLPVAADLDADDQHPGQSFAPALRNPEAPPMTVEDEVSLSPQATNGSAGEPRHEPAFGTEWRAPPAPPRETPSYFDSMWPAKPKTTPAAERPEPKPDMPRERESVARAPAPAQAQAQAGEAPRAAVLKSGVVDGMGYTLYVDGSIEAELPQGTLRFASIDELRSHLEKNG